MARISSKCGRAACEMLAMRRSESRRVIGGSPARDKKNRRAMTPSLIIVR